MITIRDVNKNISVDIQGKLTRVPTLRGHVKTETALGVEKSESTRGVINLNLEITRMSISDYDNLELLFLTSSTFEIMDSDKGTHYMDYYIVGDVLNLEEVEDLRASTYYYIGGLELHRR